MINWAVIQNHSSFILQNAEKSVIVLKKLEKSDIILMLNRKYKSYVIKIKGCEK